MWSWSRMGRRNSNTPTSMIWMAWILIPSMMILTPISCRTWLRTSSPRTRWIRRSWFRWRGWLLFSSRTLNWSSSIFSVTLPFPSTIIRDILIISSYTSISCRGSRLRSMSSSMSFTLTIYWSCTAWLWTSIHTEIIRMNISFIIYTSHNFSFFWWWRRIHRFNNFFRSWRLRILLGSRRLRMRMLGSRRTLISLIDCRYWPLRISGSLQSFFLSWWSLWLYRSWSLMRWSSRRHTKETHPSTRHFGVCRSCPS